MAEKIAAADYELYENLILSDWFEARALRYLMHINPEFAEWYRERAKARLQRKGAQR